MTINYQFGDVDAHGAMIRAQAGSLEAEHQAIISDVLTASDFVGRRRFGGLPGVHYPVGP
ncbi:ESAT-6 like protein ESXI [Mycobacterium tuberculosis]|nr:ESAT-6 like protein ESXI [Mycobacterium tuberculosis]